MAPGPFKRKPLGLDVPRTAAVIESPPGIAALFVIRFDIKAGYVISWKRALSGVEVEGAVEYKSLPSGLHNVPEDLVYFVHEQYAGISAFVNWPAEEAERNAKMFAIGVLVPLSSGRLGKSWRHAPKLKELAANCAQDMSDTKALSDYWENYEIRESDASIVPPPDSPLESPLSLRLRAHGDLRDAVHRSRAFSDAIVLETPRPALTPFHPASSLPEFLESFGPLIFPLYRAALLRKRVLFMAEAPVHIPCSYVYDLSLLASLPNSLLPLLPPNGVPPARPRPLFNVGIHDIPDLSSFIGASPNINHDSAWIACSTDSVLTMKPELFDVLVTLPAPHSKNAVEKVFPTISIYHAQPAKSKKPPQPIELKATQRDARRYSTLRKGLRNVSQDEDGDTASAESDDDSDAASTYSSSPIVEPLSWARLAYTSFIWWASAGEKRDGLSEEEEEEHQIEQDTRLLTSVETLPSPPSGSVGRRSIQPQDTSQQPPEIALVAYFRRLSAQIFITLSDVVARHDSQNSPDDEDDDLAPEELYDNNDNDPSITIGRQSTQQDDSRAPLLEESAAETDPGVSYDDSDPVKITSEDLTEMGLDIWSAADRVFVEELVRLWWGRKARVDSARIRCCGISII
ncbi:hypothetical protein BO71DRAFT_377533 [Aspergillus ellipticus CBS 707.79]|uniref:DUF4484 domain-containing protein n=1 Tax=Aspergillus ellipticus CBS 707.79 TaxID=1448320 RepID=A0A319DDT3_9EURO|nr:hypothetical protein BO71DRAFT_377533 [Aspergillus ellipticus CBS 707.79]